MMPFNLKQTTRAWLSKLGFITALVCSLPAQSANVTGISATPNPFNASLPESTTISYTVGTDSLLWLRIYDTVPALQKTLIDTTAYTGPKNPEGLSGARNKVWDGKNDGASLLPDGTYPYTIDNAFFSAHLTGGGQPFDIAVDPSNPSTIWMTNKTGPYVFKSTDGGSTFSGVSGTGSSAKDYAIEVSDNGQTIYITDDGQSSLNKSTNGGSSWGTTASFPGGSTKVIDVAIKGDGATIYALDYDLNNIYKSTDSGSSWSTCSATGMALGGSARGIGTDRATGTTVIVADSSNNRLYKSTDGCSSFSVVVNSGVSYPYQVSIQSDGKFWISERDNHRIQQFDANGTSLMIYGGTSSGSGNYQFNSSTFYFGIGLATISSQPYIFVADYGNTRIKKVGYDNWASTTHLQISSAAGVNSTTVGTATAAAASTTSINVSMPYTDDDNSNNTYTVKHRVNSPQGSWVTLTPNPQTHSATPFTTTITGLTPGESYDVEMTYNDADTVSGTNPQTVLNITLPTPVNSTTAGVATAVAASGTAIDISMPYSDDDNTNNTYTVEYKLNGAPSYTVWAPNPHAHSASPFTTTITGLNLGGTYDVRMTYNDVDTVSGTNPTIVTAIALPALSSNVSNVSVSPNPFNPDIEFTTFSYTLANSALTWIRVVDNANNILKKVTGPSGPSYTSANKTAGVKNDAWNGTDDNSAKLPDGDYPYQIDDAYFVAHHSSPTSNPNEIGVDPSNPQKMWLTGKTSPYFYKSTNGGASWSSVSGVVTANKAYGIAISADGQTIYVAQNGESQLHKSTDGGSSWGSSGALPVTTVVDVAISDDGAIVYGVDPNNNKVYKSEDSGGSWVTCTGAALSTNLPRGIATNATGSTVMVADSGGNQIWVSYDGCGFFFPFGGINLGAAAGDVDYPYQIEIQADGKFWVSERDNHRIQQFDADGNSLMVIGGTTSGSGNYQFNGATGFIGIDLAIVSDQPTIFISDNDNARVKELAYDNWTSSTDAQVRNTPPAAPTGVAAVDTPADQGGSIDLTWTVSATPGVIQQRLYRSTTPSDPSPTLITTFNNNTTAAYTDTAVTTGTTYYYVIRSYKGLQESANSTETNVAPLDNIAPNAPTGLSATPFEAEVALSWTVSNSSDVIQQKVYRSTSPGGPYSLVATIGDKTTVIYTDSAVSNGTTYYYIVRAIDVSQESTNSNESSATPDTSFTNPPTLVSGVGNDGSVDLTWTVSTSSNPAITEQRIYRSATSGSGYALLTTITNNITNSYNDSTITNYFNYYYVIRSFDGTQESPNSNEAHAYPRGNFAPVAINGTHYGVSDNTSIGTLIASDADGDPLTYTITSNGTQGTASITNSATGAYQYVPNPSFTGTDSFTFRADDFRDSSNIATVNVIIDPPVAPSAGMQTTFEMISVPTHFIQKQTFYDLFLDDLGSPPFVYKFVSDGNPAGFGGSYVQTTVGQPGGGYWMAVQTISAPTLDDDFNGENKLECDSVNFPGVQCVDITTVSGGNIIGNPYPVDKVVTSTADAKVCNQTLTPGCVNAGGWVPFSTAVSNGWILTSVYHWNPATKSYDTQTAGGGITFNPWKGYFIRVSTADSITLRFYR